MLYPRLILAVLSVTLTVPVTSTSPFRRNLCKHKVCGVDAFCNKDVQCQCPPEKPLGDPNFGCHSRGNITCDIVADPIVHSFAGPSLPVEIPCRITFAVFETSYLAKLSETYFSGHTKTGTIDLLKHKCGIRVEVVNKFSPHGTIFVSGVNVYVNLEVLARRVLTLEINIQGEEATYNVYQGGVSRERASHKKNKQGRSFSRKLNTLDMSVSYEDDIDRWGVNLDVCGTVVYYRSWKTGSDNQIIRPGASVVTNRNTATFPDTSKFPGTLCGIANNASNAYDQYCDPLSLNKRNCALYGFLYNSPANQPQDCSAVIKAFVGLHDEWKLEAVRTCGPILTQNSKCIIEKGYAPMTLLEKCFQRFESGRSIQDVVGDKALCPPKAG
jgi:hypothetical protein